MRTITFYSYKGGVGRSLALANIAIRLSELNKKVCVLDFDLEAPGLQFKFNNYSKSKAIDKGIVDYIDDYTTTGVVPSKIKDYTINLIPANKLFDNISLIPAGNIDNDLYWKKLSCINWSGMFYEKESTGVKLFLDLKYKIKKELNPDFLLIDSRTGITDIAGITLKILADEVVILAVNNQENIYGSKKIIRSLISKERLLFEKELIITFILTRIPYTDTSKDKEKELFIIRKMLSEFNKEFAIPNFEILVIHSDRRLEEKEMPLIGDDYEVKGASISNDYLKLFDKLTNKILTNEEILLFKNKKNAEREFSQGMEERDYAKKIQHFSRAIELDNTQSGYYFHLGSIYYSLKNFEKSEECFLCAYNLNPTDTFLLDYLSHMYIELKQPQRALKYIEESKKNDPDNWYPYNLNAWILQTNGKYFEALDILNDIIIKDPNVDTILNSRANVLRLLKKYSNAYEDIFRAIEINPDEGLYFATLAEIYADDDKLNEFYLNLNIAFSKGIDIRACKSASDIYQKFISDEKFIQLLNKYSIDYAELNGIINN